MLYSLQGKKIILGITGSIAAYKIPALVDNLSAQCAHVRVVMTKNAGRFVTPWSLSALGAEQVRCELFDQQAEHAMSHIELCKWADCLLVAPCSVNVIAHLALGLAPDLLTTVALGMQKNIVLAPAMNPIMWNATTTQQHIQTLQKRGVFILNPVHGKTACGDIGVGRMIEIQDLLASLNRAFIPASLKNKRIVVSAGATSETLDPVRTLTNRSSGKMGISIANAASNMGASVHFIEGHISCNEPVLANQKTKAITAQQMKNSVMDALKTADIFISVAAICDYKPKKTHDQKIKNKDDFINLKWDENEDILKLAKQTFPRIFMVGFAAETQTNQAEQKIHTKGIEMLAVNAVDYKQGFDADDNEITLLFPNQKPRLLARKSKKILAYEVCECIAEQTAAKTNTEKTT